MRWQGHHDKETTWMDAKEMVDEFEKQRQSNKHPQNIDETSIFEIKWGESQHLCKFLSMYLFRIFHIVHDVRLC